MNQIHLNQLGYRPKDVKKAVLPQEVTEFSVLRYTDKTEVLKGKTGEPIYNKDSAETVRVADFSAVDTAEEYIISTQEGDSYPFVISEYPYKRLRFALLEMLNYQKCGVDLQCGLWSHPACHTSLATIYGTTQTKDVTGGWHDAGDYGRYIAPAACTVADLLIAHELSPNPDPELLDIVWYEIEWMLKMQDEESGGVYHKVTCRTFDDLDEMPHMELEELVLSPMSLAATADFAASMALASRFYPTQKAVLLNASKRAWDFCVENWEMPNFVNPPEVSTGEYGDQNNKDECFWAACELFIATGEEKYHDAIKAAELTTGLGWKEVGTYGLIAYLYQAKEKADPVLFDKMKETLLSSCNDILIRCKNAPYGLSLDEYQWASNYDVANHARTLLLAREFTQDSPYYTEVAMAHFHYLMGTNPLSQSYVTGFGTNAIKNPHHRPTVAMGAAVPGMVSGGPNQHTHQDPALDAHCKGLPPAKCFVDHIDSYSSNEITIYWNSAVYFVMAVLGF